MGIVKTLWAKAANLAVSGLLLLYYKQNIL